QAGGSLCVRSPFVRTARLPSADWGLLRIRLHPPRGQIPVALVLVAFRVARYRCRWWMSSNRRRTPTALVCAEVLAAEHQWRWCSSGRARTGENGRERAPSVDPELVEPV